jgi:hypothetical protein
MTTFYKFTENDWRRMLAGLKQLEQDHREARNAAEERAADRTYEFRQQAVEAANFHAGEINALSILATRVWRAACEAKQDQAA